MIITYQDHDGCMRIFEKDENGTVYYNVYNYGGLNRWEKAEGMIPCGSSWKTMTEIRNTVKKRKDEVIIHDDGDL
jgi:hypothetical protein